MQAVHKMRRKQRLFVALITLSVLCLLVLSGCGYNSGTTTGGNQGAKSGSGGTATPVSTPTPASGSTPVAGSGASANGCPINTEYATDPVKADVVVVPKGDTTAAQAHVGDIVEVRLPFGKSWSNPETTQGSLVLQQPAGYGVQSDKVCAWRFTAKSAGSTELNFTARALCKPRQMCPMYMAIFPVTITVS